jgi:RHH-type proline utilization regulon transcriptional repressor/proline dehydrogenase/delta 1-pyrroline-5-carboxylate dehydrogenase
MNNTALHTAQLNGQYLADESVLVRDLLERARPAAGCEAGIRDTAIKLVEVVRRERREASGLHAFLNHYDLSSQEGVILMCLAEALLRIPDSATVDRLIADKLSAASWEQHLGASDSLFVNASTWALMLTGRMIKLEADIPRRAGDTLDMLVNRLEEPVIRAALKAALRIMAHQFVMGRTIGEALERAGKPDSRHYRYSFDMLGEAALTTRDAGRYLDAYRSAIETIGNTIAGQGSLPERPGISVKLSALCPRFEYAQKHRALTELSDKLLVLARAARAAGIGLTVDAEEANRLELMLAIFENVYRSRELDGWPGLGIAVQSYQKRALPQLERLHELAQQAHRVIPVRLVKGAYWDTEIKTAQVEGLKDFPVFTRKSNTDVSYLACARYLLEHCPLIYPQFATHNAHTLAYVYHHGGKRDYEFQRLHGMGEELYGWVTEQDNLDRPCRIYAPVGAHEDLLPYLVRRLLENGANTSFVNQIVHEHVDIDDIVADPVALTEALAGNLRHPRIILPSRLFTPRLNSVGVNFADDNEIRPYTVAIEAAMQAPWNARPRIGGREYSGEAQCITDPAHRDVSAGTTQYADAPAIRLAIDTAAEAWPAWNATTAEARARILERAADLFENRRAELAARCIRETGKTVRDSHDEVREAIDFLRYYAAACREHFSTPLTLPGPAGERNRLGYRGRGIFLCISPWNFPVAIFTGQIAAALAAGNTVIAKPAEQASLTACLAAQLLYEAGVPDGVLGFLPGAGTAVGRIALADDRVAGVAFTGSSATARIINRTLAMRNGPLPTIIAETGGQNAMLVDSSALPEQVVRDAVHSAFNSAGQRCSALRVLYLQEEIAPRILALLTGYLAEMVIGDPMDLATDIGPVIDQESQQILEGHIQSMASQGRLLYCGNYPAGAKHGYFVPPAVIEINSITQLQREVFGPVLHIVHYRSGGLDAVIDDINAGGYGLTLGIHSRIEHHAEYIRKRVRAGNVYVNRDMIGAVVGAQPFGGCGLSGTGPKAGGPNYLLRFAAEQSWSVNESAVGGNASLLTLQR